MGPLAGRDADEAKMGPHPVRVGPHRERPLAGDAEIAVVRIGHGEAVAMGAPYQAVEQAEPLQLTRLKSLCRQGDQRAGQSEPARDLRHGVRGTVERPGQLGRFDAGKHEGTGGAAPTGPVGVMGEGASRHRWRKSRYSFGSGERLRSPESERGLPLRRQHRSIARREQIGVRCAAPPGRCECLTFGTPKESAVGR